MDQAQSGDWMPDAERTVRRDLRWSLALMGAVVCFALAGLAGDGNWPKIARVALSFLAYAGTMLLWLRRGSSIPGLRVPFHWFASAGVAAGITSGLVRPHFQLPILLAGTLGAALLLGGVHWLALARWRDVRRAVTGNERWTRDAGW